MKVKLSMKNGTYYRVRILEPTPSILNALKDYWKKNNIDTNMYGEWDKVSVEIDAMLTSTGNSPALIYFFDDYKTIDYEFSSKELNEIHDYLEQNFEKYPDNYVLELGDGEYEELVDTIDEKHKVNLAIASAIVTEILDYEEFDVETYTVTTEDIDNDNILEDDVGKSVFRLNDLQGANLGGIENQIFYDFAGIIDRMDTYHTDYFYRAFEERRDADITSGKKTPNLSNGKEIEKGDWDSALLYLLSNDKFTDLLAEITPENFNELQELYNKIENNMPMGYKEPTRYMADKLIAESIIETQSAYVMVEHNNKVYRSYYGYGDEGNKDLLIKDISDNVNKDFVGNDLYIEFNNYSEVIKLETGQVLADIEDIGIEEHYLNEYAFCYLGLADEYDKAVDEINNQLSFIDDKAKMYDFTRLSKYEFLKSYSYLSEREYDATQYVYENMSKEEKESIDKISLEAVNKEEIDITED